ncbi:MAG: beta-lactamase family protein [Gammaproteobacteria bacterium]|nr:beta-lactamase family protein [Gammaproteobacteria bacterium]
MINKNLCQSILSLYFLSLSTIASDQFTDSFTSMIKQHQLPGAVVLIKKGNNIIHYDAYGKVNVEQAQLMKKDAIFRLYSMSKPITAVALLQLVEQRKVSLEDDIRKYLPGFEPFEFEGENHIVTIHQLLSHTAGFGYGGGIKSWVDIRYLLANPLSRSNTLTDLVDDLSGIDLKFPPGSRFEYSIASDIQGALIEAVSGMRLDDYLQQHIFTPLNMKDTGFYVPKRDQHRLVDMYELDVGSFEEASIFKRENILFSEKGKDSEYLERPELMSGGGGLVSTTIDYSNFVTMLQNKGQFNGKSILSEHLVEKMLSSKTTGLDTHFLPRIYQGVGFGYGIGIKETSGDTRHQGSFFWAGMGGTIFWFDPIADVQVVVMMQVEDGWIALEKWLIPEVYRMIKNQE